MKIGRTLAGIVLGSALALSAGCGKPEMIDTAYRGSIGDYEIEICAKTKRGHNEVPSQRRVRIYGYKGRDLILLANDIDTPGYFDNIQVFSRKGPFVIEDPRTGHADTNIARKMAIQAFLEEAYRSIERNASQNLQRDYNRFLQFNSEMNQKK